MSATLEKPLDEILAHVLRAHVTTGYVDSALDETRREITLSFDNIPDLEQAAVDLRLTRWTSFVHRWHGKHEWEGWHGEVRLVLVLDIPRHPFPARNRRAS